MGRRTRGRGTSMGRRNEGERGRGEGVGRTRDGRDGGRGGGREADGGEGVRGPRGSRPGDGGRVSESRARGKRGRRQPGPLRTKPGRKRLLRARTPPSRDRSPPRVGGWQSPPSWSAGVATGNPCASRMIPLESPVPEIGTPGSESGGGNVPMGVGLRPGAKAPEAPPTPHRPRASPRLYPLPQTTRCRGCGSPPATGERIETRSPQGHMKNTARPWVSPGDGWQHDVGLPWRPPSRGASPTPGGYPPANRRARCSG